MEDVFEDNPVFVKLGKTLDRLRDRDVIFWLHDACIAQSDRLWEVEKDDCRRCQAVSSLKDDLEAGAFLDYTIAWC